MPNDLLQLAVNSGGSVVTAAMFLWFLTKIFKIQEKKDEQTIKTLSGIATNLGGVEKKVEKVATKVDNLHKDHQEDREIIKQMYDHSLALAKRAGVLSKE